MSTLSTFSDIWRSFHIFPQTGVPVRSTCRASRPHGPAFSPAALRPTKYQGCRLRRQNPSKSSAYIYIYFFVSTCYPHILTYYAMNTKHDAQQLEASSVRDDLLYGCCLHAALCVHLSHLCSGAPPLSPGNYFTPCFHLSPKKVAIVISSAKWAFRHSASHYLVKPSALKMLIIW